MLIDLYDDFYETHVLADKYQCILQDDGFDIPEFLEDDFESLKEDIVAIAYENSPIYRAIALADSAYSCRASESHILRKILFSLYSNVQIPLIQFAVGMGFVLDGYHYRKYAVEYIEKSIDKINFDNIRSFISFSPLSVFGKLSELYDTVEDYPKAIQYAKMAREHTDTGVEHFNQKIALYEKHLEEKLVKRKSNPSADWIEYEEMCADCAAFLIDRWNLYDLFLTQDTPNYLPEKLFATIRDGIGRIPAGSEVWVLINPEKQTIDIKDVNTNRTIETPFVLFSHIINSYGDCNIFYKYDGQDYSLKFENSTVGEVNNFKKSLFPLVNRARRLMQQL